MNKANKVIFVGLLIASGFLLSIFVDASSVRAQSPGPTVESLAASLDALTARVAKLEGQITSDDLAGTYALRGFQVELRGGAPAQVSSYVFSAMVTLNADGTLVFAGQPEAGNTLRLGVPPVVSPFTGSDGGSFNGTWSYANGVITIPGFPPIAVGAGGRIATAASANNADGTNVILIFTRL